VANPCTFNGSGFLKQITSHQITFKFYALDQGQTNIRRIPQLGETIPDETYYDLTASDYQGRVWHCERILVNISKAASGEFIIRGGIQTITCEGELSQQIDFNGSSLEIRVFDNINIPLNEKTLIEKSIARGMPQSSISLNVWKFRCCEFDFLLTKEDDTLLIINVRSDEEKIPEYIRERILETLQFILGHPINWAVSYTQIGHRQKVTLCSPRQHSGSSRFQPPLILGGYLLNEAHHFYLLFEKYFKYIINYDQPLHPIWAQLNAVYEASNSIFIDAQALTLTVAIESFISSEFSHLGKLIENEEKSVNDALAYIDTWDNSTEIKNRIKGSIAEMRKSRVGDKMRALKKAGAVNNAQVKGWRILRNKSSHAYQAHNSSNSEFVELVFQMNVLFYHLIFYAIGYEGPYTDVSELGFPSKHYPFHDSDVE
jgi:hypothetical protein